MYRRRIVEAKNKSKNVKMSDIGSLSRRACPPTGRVAERMVEQQTSACIRATVVSKFEDFAILSGMTWESPIIAV